MSMCESRKSERKGGVRGTYKCSSEHKISDEAKPYGGSAYHSSTPASCIHTALHFTALNWVLR